MMHSPLMKIVGMTTWVITALASINIGLAPFSFNIFTTEFFQKNLLSLVVPLHYLIGLCGIVSLAMFCMACFGNCHKCGSGPCKC